MRASITLEDGDCLELTVDGRTVLVEIAEYPDHPRSAVLFTASATGSTGVAAIGIGQARVSWD